MQSRNPTPAPEGGRPSLDSYPEHPRVVGWAGATALAMGGSNQSLFLLGALIIAQGSAAIPLLALGLVLSWAAAPGWTELVLMWPKRVGGIAATCAEAFRPYSPILANLTGVCYWWGWVPTCGLTALLSASAIQQWFVPDLPVEAVAISIVVTFTAVNLCGIRWVARLAKPIAVGSAALAFLSAIVPVMAGSVDWHRALSFHLVSPFAGRFGALTSAMAGLYLIGFAAPAFEAVTCHVGEMRNPERSLPRAMLVSAAMAGLYFIVLPVIWLGVFGPAPLQGDLASTLGPTYAPLFGAAAKSLAIGFMVLNMFHGTLQPLAGAARTLSQLSEDGLVPRVLARRARSDAPWVATLLTAGTAIVLLLAGDPVWLIAAANLTYLIGIALPSVAVWLLRRNAPEMPRPYRAPRGTIAAGLAAAGGWLVATVLGFEQFGLPTVIFGVALAYSGSLLYAMRRRSDIRRSGRRPSFRSMHLKLTGAMLAVLTFDSIGYLIAIGNLDRGDQVLVTVLEDIFVAVALLTITVGLVLPGMIAHAAGEVARAADRLARVTLSDLMDAMEALGEGRLDAAHAMIEVVPVEVHSKDEIGAMGMSFNTMQGEIARAGVALDAARDSLRHHRDHLEETVTERTQALSRANLALQLAHRERQQLLDRAVEVAEQERIRLAGDLHDGPIQRLAALKMTLERIEIRLARGDTAGGVELLGSAQELTGGEIEQLRRMMADLRPPVLDERGLAAALRDQASDLEARTGIDCAVDVRIGEPIPIELETVLYRVVQEAQANAVKHAHASTLRVELADLGESLLLTVSDNGAGFLPVDDSDLLRKRHFGLAGMRERVRGAGGEFTLRSCPGEGTSVQALVPRTLPPPVESQFVSAA